MMLTGCSVMELSQMIISNSAATVPLQARDSSKPNSSPPAETIAATAPDAKPGAQGIKRLSSDAATVVLTEQGTGKTNQAAEKTPPPPPKLNLHGQDLRAADLTKLDLRGADLTGADLTGKDLSGIDLSGATLTGAKFDGATFSHSNLHGVTAAGASFTKASFDETDLDNGNYTEAKFTGATFGANFQLPPTATQVHEKCYIIKNIDLTKADFSGVTFQREVTIWNIKADGAIFDDGHLGTVGFLGGSMAGASFRRASGSIGFGDVDASNADLSHIDGGNVLVTNSKIDGATFAETSARMWFQGADLRKADLSLKGKSLQDAYFYNTVMTGMDFSGYDFSGAVFSIGAPSFTIPHAVNGKVDSVSVVDSANFHGAKFAGATFINFQIAGSLFDAGAFRDTTVMNWLGLTTHIESTNYDVGFLFRNIWPEWQANLATIRR
jgi:uncharacterized protein YjbI with pentapeptide repeats